MSDEMTQAREIAGTDTVEIRPDAENNAEEWWDAMRAAVRGGKTGLSLAARKVVRALDAGYGKGVETNRAVADEVREWASGLPGWATGPEYAREALLVVESD